MAWCACTLLHWQWDDQRRLGHCRPFFDLKVLESTIQQQTKFILVNSLILYDLSLLENLKTYIQLKNKLYLSSAVFLAQMLAGPSKQQKQFIQIQHNIVKNLNWPKANQLMTIYKHGWGFQLEATVKQIRVVVRANFEPGTSGLWVRHSDHSAKLPLILLPWFLCRSSGPPWRLARTRGFQACHIAALSAELAFWCHYTLTAAVNIRIQNNWLKSLWPDSHVTTFFLQYTKTFALGSCSLLITASDAKGELGPRVTWQCFETIQN